MTGQPPSGTVTFLLTDLEGSTRLWEHDPDAMKAAMVRHDEILENSIATNQGYVFSRMGDGMAAAFSTAGDAVASAMAIKQTLAEENWRTAEPLRARIGLHTAEAVVVDDSGYASLPINRCARLMAAAHGGQVLISGATEALVGDQLPDGIEMIDLGEHRLRDLGRPLKVFQLNHQERPEDFAPLRSLDAFPGNLPAQASSFIGRRDEIAKIASALESSRVVTITGVGGVGKTRLSMQVAADLLPHFRDGAWLIELASVREPDAVVSAVAGTFRLTDRSGQGREETLLEMLANKKLLLVLDNCEHLVASVAALVTKIERQCPGVAVLATSREGLAVDGEQIIALPPLQTGAPNDDLERLVATDAVRLFVERARHVKADFALTDHNARFVVEVCRRLDGVPLAIELAAARVIALSPAELAQRLDRRFQVLAGGRRGAVERHATLRAAIDWSFDLLNVNEQRLLGRLSAFSGGCTLAAIEDICSGAPVDADSVIDLVTALVARSLVVADDTICGTRFRMLETIRQYGEEKIGAWNESENLLARHAQYYAEFSMRAAAHYYGAEQIQWARQINFERDNIRAALATAIDTGNTPLAVRLVANHPHHHGYGGIGEVFEIASEMPTSRVLALAGASQEPGYACAVMAAAWGAYLRGDLDRAHDLTQRALQADSAHPDVSHRPRVELDACNLNAMAALAAGDYAASISAYERAAELATSDGYPGLAAIALAVSVNTDLLGGADAEEAIPKAEKAVALARQSGMHAAIVMSLNSLALTLADLDPGRARLLLEESVERSTNPDEASPSGVLTACLVAARLGDWDLTLGLGATSIALERMIIAPLQVAPCLALCARALADTRAEIAGILQGAAYATFRRAATEAKGAAGATAGPVGPNANFVLSALHDAGSIVAAKLGDQCARELRAEGAAMTMDDAITFALANIDPKLLTGWIANIDR